MQLPLADRRAIIHGGAGAIGSAIARTFVRDGAHVFLTGRTQARLDSLVAELGHAEATALDVLDEAAVNRHADAVGAVDIVVNAFAIPHVQGPPLADLTLEQFLAPITGLARGNFLTARAAARHLRPGGLILTISPPGARLLGRGWLGHGVAFAGVEHFTRLLAAELAPRRARAICLCPHAVPEAILASSHRADFEARAASAGITLAEMLDGAARSTMLQRLPSLAEVAETAAFLASPRAAAMTATTVNLSCGVLPD